MKCEFCGEEINNKGFICWGCLAKMKNEPTVNTPLIEKVEVLRTKGINRKKKVNTPYSLEFLKLFAKLPLDAQGEVFSFIDNSEYLDILRYFRLAVSGGGVGNLGQFIKTIDGKLKEMDKQLQKFHGTTAHFRLKQLLTKNRGIMGPLGFDYRVNRQPSILSVDNYAKFVQAEYNHIYAKIDGLDDREFKNLTDFMNEILKTPRRFNRKSPISRVLIVLNISALLPFLLMVVPLCGYFDPETDKRYRGVFLGLSILTGVFGLCLILCVGGLSLAYCKKDYKNGYDMMWRVPQLSGTRKQQFDALFNKYQKMLNKLLK